MTTQPPSVSESCDITPGAGRVGNRTVTHARMRSAGTEGELGRREGGLGEGCGADEGRFWRLDSYLDSAI